MPNIKSAKKRVKVIAVKTARNKANRSALKTEIKKANAAIVCPDGNEASLRSGIITFRLVSNSYGLILPINGFNVMLPIVRQNISDMADIMPALRVFLNMQSIRAHTIQIAPLFPM